MECHSSVSISTPEKHFRSGQTKTFGSDPSNLFKGAVIFYKSTRAPPVVSLQSHQVCRRVSEYDPAAPGIDALDLFVVLAQPPLLRMMSPSLVSYLVMLK